MNKLICLVIFSISLVFCANSYCARIACEGEYCYKAERGDAFNQIFRRMRDNPDIKKFLAEINRHAKSFEFTYEFFFEYNEMTEDTGLRAGETVIRYPLSLDAISGYEDFSYEEFSCSNLIEKSMEELLEMARDNEILWEIENQGEGILYQGIWLRKTGRFKPRVAKEILKAIAWKILDYKKVKDIFPCEVLPEYYGYFGVPTRENLIDVLVMNDRKNNEKVGKMLEINQYFYQCILEEASKVIAYQRMEAEKEQLARETLEKLEEMTKYDLLGEIGYAISAYDKKHEWLRDFLPAVREFIYKEPNTTEVNNARRNALQNHEIIKDVRVAIIDGLSKNKYLNDEFEDGNALIASDVKKGGCSVTGKSEEKKAIAFMQAGLCFLGYLKVNGFKKEFSVYKQKNKIAGALITTGTSKALKNFQLDEDVITFKEWNDEFSESGFFGEKTFDAMLEALGTLPAQDIFSATH